MILVVDHRDCTLRHENGCVRVEQAGEKPRRAPIAQLELVVVYGNPLAETALWRALASAGVPTVMLPARGQSPERNGPAVLAGGIATQLPLRRLQHSRAADPAAALHLARWCLRHKLQGYDLPLIALAAHHGAAPAVCAAFRQRRDQALTALAAATDLDTALGVEGQIAHAWFGLLAQVINPAWNFTGRNRRPPRDPVNALLSLGYTLVGTEIHQGVMALGLDPSLGFLHQPVPGRESMVLDLTEIFRCGVDHFVLGWLPPAGPRQTDWYYRDTEGCRLSKAARPGFFEAWSLVRGRWPYPLGDAAQPEWPHGTLREQIHGWIERLRAEMKAIDLGPTAAASE